MHFGPVPVEEAAGRILGHNVFDRDGRRVLRKGATLTAADVERLRSLGRELVYVAELESGDVGEEEAARRIAEAVAAPGLRRSGPSTGRVNLHARERGVVRVDAEALRRLNLLEGVTLATARDRSVAESGKMVATLKILPYAVPGAVVEEAVRVGREHGPLVEVRPLPARRVGLVVCGTEASRERTTTSFASALEQRLERLGSRLDRIDFVVSAEDSVQSALAAALREQREQGIELVVMAGETAIQDRSDLACRALDEAEGEVVWFGAPVDPGNLVMIGRLGEVPVLGAPGCARSAKRNIVDLVLPRLLVGEQLGREDLVELGHGGLLEDVPERPLPRERI
ncbi:MAG TPA: molybdopterin-binding protein [Thermoanaerobaculia bacterium]|nr:molybdopterin-binding protein [Thermoanaerobaculia bacterium]